MTTLIAATAAAIFITNCRATQRRQLYDSASSRTGGVFQWKFKQRTALRGEMEAGLGTLGVGEHPARDAADDKRPAPRRSLEDAEVGVEHFRGRQDAPAVEQRHVVRRGSLNDRQPAERDASGGEEHEGDSSVSVGQGAPQLGEQHGECEVDAAERAEQLHPCTKRQRRRRERSRDVNR
eukprot:1080219-Rhodomonas_salina.2